VRWFHISITPNPALGGIRYFGVIEAEGVVDAIMKAQPFIDALNSKVKEEVDVDCDEPFVISGVAGADWEPIGDQWVQDTVDHVLSALETEDEDA
jgi:hypothetical protein